MEDIKTVHYATRDPIRNLRIRVHLTRLSVQQDLKDQNGPGNTAPAPGQPALQAQPASGTALPPPALQTVPQPGSSEALAPPPPAPVPSPPPLSAPAYAPTDVAPVAQQPQAGAPGAAARPAQPAVHDPFAAAHQQQQLVRPTREGSALPMYDPAFGAQGNRQPRMGGQPIGEGNENVYPGQPGFMQGPGRNPPQQLLVPPPNLGGAPHNPAYHPMTSPEGPYMPYNPAAFQPGMIPSPGASPPPAALYAPAGPTAPIMPWGLQGPAPPPGWQPPAPAAAAPWHAYVDPSTGLPVAPPVVVPPQVMGPPSPGPVHSLPVLRSQMQGEGQGTVDPSAQRLDVTRVFAWQEKVHSTSEVGHARRRAAQRADAGLPAIPGVGVSAGGLARRRVAFGSHSTHAGRNKEDQVDPKAQGSVLFTYVHSDDFAEREELTKTVTTSGYEQEQPRYKHLLTSAKLRQEVLNFRTMYIMADLGDTDSEPHTREVVLVCVKAYQDGSFDMRPGFSRPGKKYRFEDDRGCIYEYTVEDAGAKAEPSLAKRTAKLQKQVAARAAELRAIARGNSYFQPPPGEPGSIRLTLFGEIMGCADFDRDHLYIEYVFVFDPAKWEMVTTDWAAADPGVYKGVTATTRVRLYPADPASNTSERWVGHFAHPIECEVCSRGPEPTRPNYPTLLFQVCSLDKRNRYASLGYCWLNLGDCCPGSGEHTLRCWKPLQGTRDKHEEYFIGGSRELQDIQYIERGPLRDLMNRHNTLQPPQPPEGKGAKSMNKYGLKTETTGCIKVRLHCMTQQRPDDDTGDEIAGGVAVVRTNDAHGPQTPPGSPGKRRRELTLAAVVERARNRLRDARGGEVSVRPGVVSEAPAIRQHPVDQHISEGQVATFKVQATGLEPLVYQWFKDGQKLVMATSDSPQLIVAEVSPLDAGTYHCQVTNKDGNVVSNKAVLKVDKLGRAHRAAGTNPHDETRSQASHTTRTSDRPGTPGRSAAAARVGRMQAAAAAGRLSPAASERNTALPALFTKPATPVSDTSVPVAPAVAGSGGVAGGQQQTGGAPSKAAEPSTVAPSGPAGSAPQGPSTAKPAGAASQNAAPAAAQAGKPAAPAQAVGPGSGSGASAGGAPAGSSSSLPALSGQAKPSAALPSKDPVGVSSAGGAGGSSVKPMGGAAPTERESVQELTLAPGARGSGGGSGGTAVKTAADTQAQGPRKGAW